MLRDTGETTPFHDFLDFDFVYSWSLVRRKFPYISYHYAATRFCCFRLLKSYLGQRRSAPRWSQFYRPHFLLASPVPCRDAFGHNMPYDRSILSEICTETFRL